MKVFDSGMPEESYWNSLFDIPAIVDWLDLKALTGPVAEIGCGYGTFTVPVAGRTEQIVHAFDLEPRMIRIASENVKRAGLGNVTFACRDVLEAGTGLPANSVGMVLLINILHSAERTIFLAEASRILRDRGRVVVIHWRKDVPTPRGPSVESRPDLRAMLEAAAGTGLRLHGEERILAPFHWGVQLVKSSAEAQRLRF